MKIVQVLTYVSADGAYGGPVAVARNQCQTLAKRGHDVHLVAGWDGVAQFDLPGVHVHLHRVRAVPGLGFAGFLSPGVWSAVWRLSRDADAVHFHFARDLVQLPAALLASIGHRRTFLQTHGMVRPDSRLLARILDACMVRPVYRRAFQHLLLTQREVDELPAVARTDRLPWTLVRNAIGIPPRQASWAGSPTVLFLARLHERKRPEAFVEMADVLVQSGFAGSFDMYGPDEGEAAAVAASISRRGLQDSVRYHGSLDPSEVESVLIGGQIYVLPSVDEPFPMSLLEALAAGLPSIITDRTGLSEELASRHAAAVTSGEPSEMAAAVRELVSTPEVWSAASVRARHDAETEFSSEALARNLEIIYASTHRPVGGEA